jgi:hypothetical protein
VAVVHHAGGPFAGPNPWRLWYASPGPAPNGSEKATTAEWVAAIGQVAGAVATFIAVFIALWVAIREHRDLRRRLDDQESAQARKVSVKLYTDAISVRNNNGDESLTEVEITDVSPAGTGYSWVPDADARMGTPCLEPGECHEARGKIVTDSGTANGSAQELNISVRYRDSADKVWIKNGNQPPRRASPVSRDESSPKKV